MAFQWEITDDEICRLRFNQNGQRTTISFWHPFRRSQEEWMGLITAIRNRTAYRLDFIEGDHESGYIYSSGENLVFEAYPRCEAGDFSIVVEVPNSDLYANQFLDLLQHPIMEQGWARGDE